MTESDCETIEQAIEEAENNCSGEIRVHVDKTCLPDVRDSAADKFAELGMHKTKQRNGVLIYIAAADRKFAVIGDVGINSKVNQDFWDDIIAEMKDCFIRGEFCSGIVHAVKTCGDKLRKYFPPTEDDENELPNAVSFGR